MAQTSQYNDLLKEIDMQRLPRHIAIIMDGNGPLGAGKKPAS